METTLQRPTRRHRLLRRLGIALLVLVVLLLAAVGFGSNYLVEYAIGRSGDGGNREVALEVEPGGDSVEATIAANKATQETANAAFTAAHPARRWASPAGTGWHCPVCTTRTGTATVGSLPCTGYRGTHKDSLRLATHYYDAGFQVLTPDLRACGDSEGNYVGMGWLDRQDVLGWIDWIVARGPRGPHRHPRHLDGGGHHHDDRRRTHPRQRPRLCGGLRLHQRVGGVRQRAGPAVRSAGVPRCSTRPAPSPMSRPGTASRGLRLDQVARCEKPMLFIHGTADDFIPYAMLDTLYNAKPGTNKAELTAQGAGHGEAMYALGDVYWNTVWDFLAPYLAD